MKIDELKTYIEGMKDEATKGVYGSIRMLNDRNLSSSEYNHYAIALTKAQAQIAVCQQIIERINKG